MKLREVGGALAMTAVITTGCSENLGADPGITEATRPSKDQIYEVETPYTKARDCAVDLAVSYLKRSMCRLTQPQAPLVT